MRTLSHCFHILRFSFAILRRSANAAAPLARRTASTVRTDTPSRFPRLSPVDNSDLCVTQIPTRTFAMPYVSTPFRSHARSGTSGMTGVCLIDSLFGKEAGRRGAGGMRPGTIVSFAFAPRFRVNRRESGRTMKDLGCRESLSEYPSSDPGSKMEIWAKLLLFAISVARACHEDLRDDHARRALSVGTGARRLLR